MTARCQIHTGDALEMLRGMKAESAQLCVTSPPYWNLRDYKAEGQIGMEKTPDEYVARLVDVFREVRRVLHPTGSVWLNLGDGYASGKGTCFNPGGGDSSLEGHAKLKDAGAYRLDRGNKSDIEAIGLKPLDILGMPWRVAFALQADGWWLRSASIWAKPNPLPESVAGWRWERCRVKVKAARRPRQEGHHSEGREYSVPIDQMEQSEWQDCPGCAKCSKNDGLVLRRGSWRPTQSYEMLFLLAKSADYYGDGEGVKEPNAPTTSKWGATNGNKSADASAVTGGSHGVSTALKNKSRAELDRYYTQGRNLRSVWTIPTQGFPGSHFATYPLALVRPMILSGTPDAGVCSECGTPWARVRVENKSWRDDACQKTQSYPAGSGTGRTLASAGGMSQSEYTHHGWRPACSCDAPSRPAVVLDCFAGSGTTGCVALELGRHFVGIELNPEYAKMANERIARHMAEKRDTEGVETAPYVAQVALW